MPEDLPTPKSSIKEIEQKSQKQLQRKKMNKYSRKRGRFDLVFVAKKALKTTALSDKILYEKVVTKQ